MASAQYFPPLPELFMDEDMIGLLSAPLSDGPGAQTDALFSAQLHQDTEPICEDAEAHAQLSTSPFVSRFEKCATILPEDTMPVANQNQTDQIKLEPDIGSYVSRPEAMQAAAQAQRLKIALDAVSLVRNGKRFLKPWHTNLTPVRLVQMFPQQQLEESVQSLEQVAAKLLGRYTKQRVLHDMLGGVPSDQCQARIRESLLTRLREIVGTLVRRGCLLTCEDFNLAKAEAKQRRDVWFALLLVRLVEICLQSQYVDFSDNSTKEHWFQGRSYRIKCCELEAWKAACQVLSRAVNEEVQRLDERVYQYLHGQATPSASSKGA